MTAETHTYVIRRGRTEVDVPHRGSYITFIHKKYGPGTYADVKSEIEKDNLKPPTMAETASLLYQTYVKDNGREPEFKEIINLMKDEFLWVFTGTLFVPKGAYVEDNPETRDGMPFMQESELVRKLEANDPSVRFVPFGYKTKEMSPSELAKNPYVIALAGEEGAEKLAEVAGKHKEKPYLWSFKSVDKPLTRVSAVDSVWGLDGGLGVGGDARGDDGGGCAFGVYEKTGEASRAEK